jgi:hypothetical protein
MNRPDIKLLLGILLVCAVAVAVAGCAELRSREWFGGIGFDLVGAGIQGLVGN